MPRPHNLDCDSDPDSDFDENSTLGSEEQGIQQLGLQYENHSFIREKSAVRKEHNLWLLTADCSN